MEESEWEGTRNACAEGGLWSIISGLSLGPISNQLGFVGMEAALFEEEGTNPIPGVRSSPV